MVTLFNASQIIVKTTTAFSADVIELLDKIVVYTNERTWSVNWPHGACTTLI